MKVNCPTCQKAVAWTPAAKHRPFCSERCRLIDLGQWADGTYAISQPLMPHHSATDPILPPDPEP